jgi:hypothetical protein
VSTPYGRRILPGRILQCRCDAASLLVKLPVPFAGSFCNLCNIKRTTQPTPPESKI